MQVLNLSWILVSFAAAAGDRSYNFLMSEKLHLQVCLFFLRQETALKYDLNSGCRIPTVNGTFPRVAVLLISKICTPLSPINQERAGWH